MWSLVLKVQCRPLEARTWSEPITAQCSGSEVVFLILNKHSSLYRADILVYMAAYSYRSHFPHWSGSFCLFSFFVHLFVLLFAYFFYCLYFSWCLPFNCVHLLFCSFYFCMKIFLSFFNCLTFIVLHFALLLYSFVLLFPVCVSPRMVKTFVYKRKKKKNTQKRQTVVWALD